MMMMLIGVTTLTILIWTLAFSMATESNSERRRREARWRHGV
jgi:hypothetical protein